PASGPAPRYHHAMIYDSVRERVVLHGGPYCNCYGYAGQPGAHGDVWEWGGEAWAAPGSTAVAMWYAAAPPGSSHHAMALDPRFGRVVMRGGGLGNSLWGFMNGQWFERTGAGASGRYEVPM